ncbi:transporter [Azospirillum sp. 11R-A]|uniref:ZIP family metal transporter n=1 Tax=Azospirillum sp. 11R-A TaxID=3111634 RepID=UPI003C185555
MYQTVLLSTIIPVAAAIGGGAATAYWPPSRRFRSIVQHLAAGVVFAAAAAELLPDVIHANAPWSTLLGATIGVLTMLALEQSEERFGGSVGMTVVAGVDVFVDGFVLGLGFLQGAKEGLLLTIALTVELLFLGLSVAGAFGSDAGKPRVVAVTTGIAMAMPVGAVVGLLLGGLPQTILSGFFAFGLVALLYLVTEELLTEAHEVPDTPMMPVAFFVGFLGLIYLEEFL